MVEQAVTAPEVSNIDESAEVVDERYVTPPVDIVETPEGLLLLADMPGVAPDGLEVSVDHDVLTIRGRSSYVAPGGNGHRKGGLPPVFRQFKLGGRIDPANIGAELKHGVLRLHLPKAEAAKAQKVEVKVS